MMPRGANDANPPANEAFPGGFWIKASGRDLDPGAEQKLAQYPKGTGFTLDVSPLDPQIAPVIVSELMKFADAQGITIRR